jgi:secondary thiamine-phosphate synthase enzyme
MPLRDISSTSLKLILARELSIIETRRETVKRSYPKEASVIHEITVRTRSRNELVDITERVREILEQSAVREGICHVFVPHTTAAITVNEKADPDVARDIRETLSKLVPEGEGYRHAEGNSDAHVKSSLVGVSVFVPVSGGDLLLGTWQAIFFCEFDGPRTRRCRVSILEERPR